MGRLIFDGLINLHVLGKPFSNNITFHHILKLSSLPQPKLSQPSSKKIPLTIIITTNLTTIIITGSDYETLIRYSEPDKEILRTEFSITVIVKVVPDQNHSFGDDADGNDEV